LLPLSETLLLTLRLDLLPGAIRILLRFCQLLSSRSCLLLLPGPQGLPGRVDGLAHGLGFVRLEIARRLLRLAFAWLTGNVHLLNRKDLA
jgi:hypothetical protein